MALVIGLIYSRNENWIAGSYYIQNLVHALASLKTQQPHIKIFSEKESEYDEIRIATGYSSMEWIPMNDRNTFADRILNKISYTLLKKHLISRGIDTGVDVLFPASNFYLLDNIKNKLIWIPDFQEHHYPNLFSQEDIAKRKTFQQWVVNNNYPIVVSSCDSEHDFKQIYPQAKNKVFVMPFAVTIPDLKGIQIDELRKKFQLNGEYFICSNQFWAHKNHKIVLEALLALRKNNIKVVFTGKPHDDRNPNYYPSLMEFVHQNKLEESALFLGFIGRAEQLVLMKHSLAIIQPSLFEGWSTVVEDAKALNVPILVSDIPVHREQIDDIFFDKENHSQLAEKMMCLIDNRYRANQKPYKSSILDFGQRFIDIVNQMT